MVVRELTSCSTSTMVASLSKQFDSKHRPPDQGWARDIKARDRDLHLPRPRWCPQQHQHAVNSRDETKTFKFRHQTETRRL